MTRPDFTKIDLGSPSAKSISETSISGKDWVSPEGIAVKPHYSAADTKGLKNLNTMPGSEPYIRGPYPTM